MAASTLTSDLPVGFFAACFWAQAEAPEDKPPPDGNQNYPSSSKNCPEPARPRP